MNGWRGWRWIIGMFLLATAWGVVGVRSSHAPEATEVIVTHGPRGEAPWIRVTSGQVTYGLPLLTGAWRSSQDDQGSMVVICFWAPWCDPCLDLLAWLERYGQSLAGQPVTMLTVGVEADAQSVKAASIQLPMALLPETPPAEAAVVTRLPWVWVVSPEGRLVWAGEGYGSRLQLEREVARGLKSRSGGTASHNQEGTRP